MILGTRGSKLALAQANIVSSMLGERGVKVTLKIIKTTGDTFTDRPLHEVAGVGAFVREIDDRMLAGEIDLAVHSMKDVPTVRPAELGIAAVLKRDSPFDVLLTRDGTRLDDLPRAAVIGTTSMRRRAQLLRYRHDLVIRDLRGNIDTRLRKLREGQYDGIMLAEAGLERMKWELDVERLPTDKFCPSANQGTIVIIARNGSEAFEAASVFDHPDTRMETRAERIIIGILGGGCIVPIGAFAKIEGSGMHVGAEVLSVDGKRYVSVSEHIPIDDYEKHAFRLGNRLKDMGGAELVREAVEKLRPKT